MQRSKDGALMQGFYKLEKINDGVPMLEDWVPMQKDWVPMQEHTTVFVEQASPVKKSKKLGRNRGIPKTQLGFSLDQYEKI
jgi:hypothetical protein